MRATTQFPEATKRERIAVNTKELQAMLGCGRKTAVDIGEQAGAKIQIGRACALEPHRSQGIHCPNFIVKAGTKSWQRKRELTTNAES